jgi:hypothetical protein
LRIFSPPKIHLNKKLQQVGYYVLLYHKEKENSSLKGKKTAEAVFLSAFYDVLHFLFLQKCFLVFDTARMFLLKRR